MSGEQAGVSRLEQAGVSGVSSIHHEGQTIPDSHKRGTASGKDRSMIPGNVKLAAETVVGASVATDQTVQKGAVENATFEQDKDASVK